MKKLIGIIIALIVLAVSVFLVIRFVDFSPAKESASKTSDSTTSKIKSENTAKMTIDVTSIKDKPDTVKENIRPLIPEDGFIFKETEVEFKEGETVSALLERIVKEQKIAIDIDKSQGFFVKSLGNISIGDAGSNSFWGFRVNDKVAEVGADQIVLKKDDKIEWVFVLTWEDL